MRRGEILSHAPTYPADGAVRGKRYGQFTALGVKECDTQGERVDCVIAADAADKASVTCYVGGVHEVLAGAALAAVAELMTDNEGRAITYVAAGANRLSGLLDPGQTAGVAGDEVLAWHWSAGVNF